MRWYARAAIVLPLAAACVLATGGCEAGDAPFEPGAASDPQLNRSAAPDGGEIRGRVASQGLGGLPGITVTAQPGDLAAITDGAGNYTLTGVF